jgi:PhnB protein
MKRLNVYLFFGGNCRTAMEFYKECLRGELRLMTVRESPMASQMPPAMMDRVMHAALESDGMVIMASDMLGPEGVVRGNTISLCVNGTDKREIEAHFDKLSAGGRVKTALREEFFGTYGDFTDKFGIAWIFQADPPKR